MQYSTAAVLASVYLLIIACCLVPVQWVVAMEVWHLLITVKSTTATQQVLKCQQ